ncbi:uncharacterized protein LOC133413648 isoform X2 [Phycodurus eques]|uniref:uncharacterized protein LOC133413648 isoform X2 n=1 Tax=Phycodurus eques TaxID=693459 RepID=UPI002ACE5407|nr:uncharacterized protein LOC133413648 isoform X2 [Phycodurus eques]
MKLMYVILINIDYIALRDSTFRNSKLHYLLRKGGLDFLSPITNGTLSVPCDHLHQSNVKRACVRREPSPGVRVFPGRAVVSRRRRLCAGCGRRPRVAVAGVRLLRPRRHGAHGQSVPHPGVSRRRHGRRRRRGYRGFVRRAGRRRSLSRRVRARARQLGRHVRHRRSQHEERGFGPAWPLKSASLLAVSAEKAGRASYVAFMHRKGSVFLQTFCSLLEDEDHTGMELMRLMTRLSHRVAFTFRAKGREFGGKKEMPCLLSRMTRDVFPFAKGPAPAPAVTFVARDVTKKRPASIG